MHMRHDHQVVYCPPSDRNCFCEIKSTGVWSESEAFLCLALLPSECDFKSLSIKALCETYVWIARVLFPTRMRARALKVLLTFGSCEPDDVRKDPRLAAHALLGQLCLMFRKVYKVDLVTRSTERSNYYLKLWSLCSPLVSWTLECNYVSPMASSPPQYLLPECVPGSGLSYFSREWRRPCERSTYLGLREDRVKFCRITSSDIMFCCQMMNVPFVLAGD